MYNINIDFEYDPDKSEANFHKHGITFEDAKKIWLVDHADMAGRTVLELRKLVIGPVGDKIYTCVYTYRNGKVRIISARRSRPREEKVYYEQTKED